MATISAKRAPSDVGSAAVARLWLAGEDETGRVDPRRSGAVLRRSERGVVVFRRRVFGSRAGAVVEVVVRDEARFVALQDELVVVGDLLLAAGDVPEAEFVDFAGEPVVR